MREDLILSGEKSYDNQGRNYTKIFENIFILLRYI